MTGNGDKAIPFDPERPNEMLNPAGLCDMRALYERIWRGGYPQLIQYPTMPVHDFFSSYLQTYVERDVQELAQIDNIMFSGRVLAKRGG